jgi:predicted transcriptional regulator
MRGLGATIERERPSAALDDAQTARAATRLILSFVEARLFDAAPLFGGDLTATLVGAAVTRANVGHVDEEEALFRRWSDVDSPPPDEIRRPVSGYMAAHWLGLSRETVRRKLKDLVALGMIERVGEGYLAPARAAASPQFAAFTVRSLGAAGCFFRALAQLGYVPPALVLQASAGPRRPRMCARAVGAFVPPALDTLKTLTRQDLTSAIVLAELAVASMGSPPQPLSALALAERLGLPRETARRHVSILEALGLASRTRAGLTVPIEMLDGPIRRAVLDRGRCYREALLPRLAQAGVLAPAPT